MDSTYAAVGQFDVQPSRLTDQRLEFEPGVLADQGQLEAEQRGQPFMTAEVLQQQRLIILKGGW